MKAIRQSSGSHEQISLERW